MRAHRWTLALAVASVAFVLFAAVRRDSLATVWGDESTYLAMAESLARDGDLRFTEADAERLQSAVGRHRDTVILQQEEGGAAYSKPIVYALLSAPGFLVAGETGLVAVNVLLLLAAAWAGWLFLCRLGDRRTAALTLVTFVGAGVLLAHVGWRMSDLAQAALSLAGLSLALAAVRRPRDRSPGGLDGASSAAVAGLLLGALVSARIPNVLIVAAALAALVVAGRWRRGAVVAAAAAAGFLGLALLSWATIGAANPYRALRASFDAASGYPVTASAETPRPEIVRADAPEERFETHRTTQAMGVVPRLQPSVTAYASLYFLVGRHTGVLWYFPAVIALSAAALRRPDRVTLVLLLGAVGAAGFYLVWWPWNYFGGSAFLGNRYFLPVYPMLLVALPRLPGRLGLTVSWLVAAIVGGSAVAALASPEPAVSQSHTRAGLLALAPYESTGRNIDGRRDRYWAGDLLRFTDPVSPVAPESFLVEAGLRPTEVLLVTPAAERSMLLRYAARRPGLELAVNARGAERRFSLDRDDGSRKGSLIVPLGPAWRRHTFWWSYVDRYAAHAVRLSVAGSEDPEARVRLWYGGDPAELERAFEYWSRDLTPPRTAPAGGRSRLAVRVRNMSPVPWAASGPFPVTLSYRLRSLDDPRSPVVEGRRVELPSDLPSGDAVDLALPVEWPAAPGRYRIDVDLLIEDYAWFVERVGTPVAAGEVEVVEAS